MPKITRRETLAAGPGVIAAAAVLPIAAKAALASEGEDMELIALWHRLQSRWGRMHVLRDAEERLHPHRETRKREYAKAENRTSQVLGELDDIEHQIAAIPANTFAGLAIKLRIGTDNQIFRWALEFKVEELSTDELNLMTALADAERLAGRAL